MTAPDIARIVETARRAAAAAHHAFVGTEHLLAAALTTPDGSAARALGAAGVSLDGLSEELLTGLPSAEGDQPGPPPLSRFAERAIAEAEKSGGNLAAALLRAPKGRIASVLGRRGADLQLLRRAVEPDQPPKPSAASRTRPEAKRPPTKAVHHRAAQPDPAPIREPAPPPRRLPPHLEPRKRRTGVLGALWLLLLLGVPASALLDRLGFSSLLVFLTACLGVLPLAGLMGQATEQLAERTGPTIGGLLNATFGNAAELIIALVALQAGLVSLVKASITGSILGNLLLILGLSLIAGGAKSPILRFSRTSAGMGSAMLALAVVGLVFPALFHGLHPGLETARFKLSELGLSEVVAVILATTYAFSLLFSLHTHKAMFSVDPASTPEGATWGVGRSVLVLAGATVGTVIASELLVHSVKGVTTGLGLSETFLGLIVIPIIGNAAEHATAVMMARRGKTDLSLQIALGSSTQVALLVAPLLVLAGLLMGQPVDLVFTPLEVVALAVSTGVVAIITLDGESHWFEGVQLLALYGMVGAAAYFI